MILQYRCCHQGLPMRNSLHELFHCRCSPLRTGYNPHVCRQRIFFRNRGRRQTDNGAMTGFQSKRFSVSAFLPPIGPNMPCTVNIFTRIFRAQPTCLVISVVRIITSLGCLFGNSIPNKAVRSFSRYSRLSPINRYHSVSEANRPLSPPTR